MLKSKDRFGSVSDALGRLLDERLKLILKDRPALTQESCNKIYVEIFDTVASVFQESGANAVLSNESVNYIAQALYESIKINETGQTLDPNIFSKRAKLENISTKELAFMYVVFRDSEMCLPIGLEIKRRH